MAPSADSECAWGQEWMDQLKAMKDAIAQLNLPQTGEHGLPYGHDIVVDDRSSAQISSDEDLWDLISGEEDSSGSDVDGVPSPPAAPAAANGVIHDASWLAEVCGETASLKSGLRPDELYDQLLSSLAASNPSKSYCRSSLAVLILSR